MLGWAIVLAASLLWPAVTSAQTASPPLILEAKIPLGEVSGRIDHLGIDVKRQRLFVAELGNTAWAWSIWQLVSYCAESTV